jgi:hypothetical protein
VERIGKIFSIGIGVNRRVKKSREAVEKLMPDIFSDAILSEFTRQECVSVNIEEPGLLFTSSFAEGVIRLTDLNLYEPRLY